MNIVNEGVILWDLEHPQISHFIAQALEFSRSSCSHQEKSPPPFPEAGPHHTPGAGPCNHLAVQCACPSLPVWTSSLHAMQAAGGGDRGGRWYHLFWQQHRHVPDWRSHITIAQPNQGKTSLLNHWSVYLIIKYPEHIFFTMENLETSSFT